MLGGVRQLGHFAPGSLRLHRQCLIPRKQITTNKTHSGDTQWQPCPLPASVLCTAVIPKRTTPSFTFPRTRSVIPPPGSRQPEPPKPRQDHPPTSVSAPPSAARWQ